MTRSTDVRMPGTPPVWLNATMGVLLRTPLVQRFVGRMFGLITVTGATTGRRYTTPVQFLVHGDEFVVLSQRSRKWWRNVRREPVVELRVAGRDMSGRARIADAPEAESILADCLAANPRVAKFYGLEALAIDVEAVRALLDHVVVLVLEPVSQDIELTEEDLVIEMR